MNPRTERHQRRIAIHVAGDPQQALGTEIASSVINGIYGDEIARGWRACNGWNRAS